VVLLDAPRPGGIEYLYGKIPKAVDGLPAFSLPHPRYVLVTEQIGASAIPGGRLVYSDGHWEYQAHFRCHALTLLVESNLSTVETNLSGRPISRLGKRILGLERCTGN
jgi:hypothetical protein